MRITETMLKRDHPNMVMPAPDKRDSQREWDDAVSKSEFTDLLNSAHQIDQARLLAAASPHTGSWIQALPLPQLGLNLGDEPTRIAVSLRLGTPICEPHRCRCGQRVNEYGRHGLSCKFSAGRNPRHTAINDIVKRALATAGIPAVLELVGLDKSSSRRPDGVSVFPFSQGKCLSWDATVSDTFAKTALMDSAASAGSAARKAEERKIRHYQALEEQYRFTPISLETTGVYGNKTETFIQELGRRMRGNTGDVRQTQWLRQRLSIAIARGNASSILATGNFYPE